MKTVSRMIFRYLLAAFGVAFLVLTVNGALLIGVVLHYGAKCAYIATAEILDEEMAERVRLHKARRPRTRWINFEAPYNAHEVLCEAAQEADAVLFDCLTLYMSNLLYGKNAPQGTTEEKAQVVKAEIAKLIEAAEAGGKITVFVTNEVGAGIVPGNAMAREYRDIAGWVNQQVADAADSVFYCVAGQAVDMKKLAFKFEEE